MVSLLTLESGVVDWRRFLLSAALPWPQPSLAQLLLLLQGFRTADPGATGCVDQEKYLQVAHGHTHIRIRYALTPVHTHLLTLTHITLTHTHSLTHSLTHTHTLSSGTVLMHV